MGDANPLQSRLERWAQKLQNLTVSPLTRDYPEPTTSEPTRRAIEAFESHKISPEIRSAAEKLSGPNGSYITFLTAYVVLVSRLTGDEDIALGTSSEDDGRPFVLRVPISLEQPFSKLRETVQKVG